MTAPGDDGEGDSGRESTDERTGSPGDPDPLDEESVAGTVQPGEGSPGRHRQEREFRRRVAGRDEQPTAEDSGETWGLFARDVVTSVAAVALLGMYIFAMSGVWPPMVAIESGSMEPNMEVDDLVFLMETERFQPEEAHPGTGVVTAAAGDETGYGNYGASGDVIVFEPDGDSETTPVIHRAMFWVEEGENWCEQADPAHLGSLEPDSERCVAPNDGFITKGDNNARYDQASLQTDRPVKPEWVVGTAEFRVPRLGWFRLQFR